MSNEHQKRTLDLTVRCVCVLLMCVAHLIPKNEFPDVFYLMMIQNRKFKTTNGKLNINYEFELVSTVVLFFRFSLKIGPIVQLEPSSRSP